jgi:hypothetical protein
MTYDPAEHTIDEVHDHLAKHPEDKDAVLAAEKARGDDARSTLVSSLEGGGNNGKQADQPPATREGEAPVKPEDANISPPGEYPDDREGTWGYHSDEPGVQAGRQEG